MMIFDTAESSGAFSKAQDYAGTPYGIRYTNQD